MSDESFISPSTPLDLSRGKTGPAEETRQDEERPNRKGKNEWPQGFHGPVSIITDVILDGQESFEWQEYAQCNEVLRATAAINGDGEETAPFGNASSDRFQTIETVDKRLLLVLFLFCCYSHFVE